MEIEYRIVLWLFFIGGFSLIGMSVLTWRGSMKLTRQWSPRLLWLAQLSGAIALLTFPSAVLLRNAVPMADLMLLICTPVAIGCVLFVAGLARMLYLEYDVLGAALRSASLRRRHGEQPAADSAVAQPPRSIHPVIGAAIGLVSIYLLIRHLATAGHLVGMFWFFPMAGYVYFAAGSLCCSVILASFAIGLMRRRR